MSGSQRNEFEQAPNVNEHDSQVPLQDVNAHTNAEDQNDATQHLSAGQSHQLSNGEAHFCNLKDKPVHIDQKQQVHDGRTLTRSGSDEDVKFENTQNANGKLSGKVTFSETNDTSCDTNVDLEVDDCAVEYNIDDSKEITGCCGWRTRMKQPSVGTFGLFRFASPMEIVMMVVGTVMSMAAGCSTPLSLIVFADIVDVYIENLAPQNSTGSSYDQQLQDSGETVTLNFTYIGIGNLISSFLAVSLWTWAGERQITRIRKLFFRGVMRQDIGWFDTHEVGELNSRFSEDTHKISEGLCDKMPVFIQWVSTFVCSYIIAFVKGWKLALVCLAFSPLIGLVGFITARMIRSMACQELQAYAKAGAVAEQTLRGIRTVQAFQGQEKEEKRYEDNLASATKMAAKKGLVFGSGTASYWFVIYVMFGVTFYYGVVLLQSEAYNPGDILAVVFNILLGSVYLGRAFPNIESFANARAAAVKVFEVIDLHPAINISSTSGKILKDLQGVIQFRNLHFRYPARPTVPVLNGLNLTVNPGQQVALVGASGCGKSTTIQLLQRFYDPEGGQVTVDGHDIRDLNLKWLRDQIGVVSQEPVLFAATIAENIRYGKPDVTQSEIEAASKEANAHDFIKKLPQGYNTLIGERGAQLSGGQKQRIAIARALVRNPRILLLDEATSALDHESEAVVQTALEKAEVGRTTIVIAHRLSTIRYADNIVSLSHGQKEEEGTHDELIAQDGLYAQLVSLQTKAEESAEEDTDHCEEVQNGDITLSLEGRERSQSFGARKKDKTGDVADDEDKDNVSNEEETVIKPASFKRVLGLSSPEWLQIVVGSVLSAFCGLSHPGFALANSEFIFIFSIPDQDEQTKRAVLVVVLMVSVSAALAIFRLILNVCFAKSGAALTTRLRGMTFKAILKQDMSFFDASENQVGTLTTRLASDAALVQGATGSKIGNLLESLTTIVASLIIAFVFGWKLTFVILAFLPVMILAGKVQGKVITGAAQSEKSQLHEAGKVCSEAVDNIRTVVSINRADVFIDKLEKLLNEHTRAKTKRAFQFGFSYAFATSISLFALAGGFAYGTKLIVDGEMEFQNVFRVFVAIIYGGTEVGRSSSVAVDFTKGRLAAGRLFALIDLLPKIDVNKPGGHILNNYTGRVEVEGVVFHYPTRPTLPVLNELTVAVEPGQTLALVGGSGCGKSTVLQLLQRFYDPDGGALVIDGHDLRGVDLRWFRQQLGIVSQEPTLFDGSISTNIAYGDNSRAVPMAEIIAAARAANIHSFIESLPQGYETSVGDKGTQLSGGQKQRIAIARALVRRPKVLLLDEATSALDTESERVVQEALDKAREGRTCIVIAHRLTTIQNADRIAVISQGRVQEIGTHSELVKKQGIYYGLLLSQGRRRSSVFLGPQT